VSFREIMPLSRETWSMNMRQLPKNTHASGVDEFEASTLYKKFFAL
jgi:hypothetical protein